MPKRLPCPHNPIKQCKECTKAKARLRTNTKRAANPEAARARKRELYHQNPERAAKHRRDSYARHGDKRRAEAKASANPQRKSELAKARRAANPDKAKQQDKEWRLANPDKVRAGAEKRWGIVWAPGQTYESCLSAQKHRCQICLLDLSKLKRRQIHVDHDHAINDGSPNVRGVLCAKCNKALGLFGDRVETLRRAGDYLVRGNHGY